MSSLQASRRSRPWPTFRILESLDKFKRTEIADKTYEKPNFTQGLENLDELKEGQAALLQCHVQPAGDPKMKVEWFLNGRPLQNGTEEFT